MVIPYPGVAGSVAGFALFYCVLKWLLADTVAISTPVLSFAGG